MKITFCGAAQTVTGSQHLIEINGKKLLLDCGLFQGKREESFKMNRHFLFDPSSIDCVLLSHAHIDHSGNLPTLYMKGFRGSIYSTPATRDLCSIMLQDSAHIQEKDVAFVNKKRSKKHQSLFNPLYTIEDAINVLKLFRTVPYNQPFVLREIDDRITVTFIEAGHILGSAQILLEINLNGEIIKLGFTGDLGRKNLPILKDPDWLGDVDFLITESTYGNRLHDPLDVIEQELPQVINDTLSNSGKIIVPAFSIGRTQDLIYHISKLLNENKIKDFPVFIDSPLSVNATEVFKLHPECFDKETLEFISNGINIFNRNNISYIRDVNDSKKLNNVDFPCMIVSASGMCEAGRILHHLANNIENPNTLILIIGFMAENTLGRKIIDLRNTPGAKVKIFGDEFYLRARVKIFNSFSAHADANELLDYFALFNKTSLRKIFLVHGEEKAQTALLEKLTEKGFKNIYAPSRGDSFEFQ